MPDFGSGKTKLVNVCTYCNYVLGIAKNEKDAKNDMQIADINKRLTDLKNATLKRKLLCSDRSTPYLTYIELLVGLFYVIL